MKKYFLSLLFVLLAVGYVFPAQAFEMRVDNYAGPGTLARGKYYQNHRVNDAVYFFHTGSPTGIGWGNADWVQIDSISILRDGDFKPVSSCQGIEFQKTYYSDVNITINQDGSCVATVK